MKTPLVTLVALALCGPALASGTSTWEVTTRLELLKGEFKQTCLTSRGEVVLGRATREVKAPNTSVWSSAVGPDGTLWVGTSGGRVCRLADDKLETVFETTEMLVTAIVVDGEAIYAATLPNGQIFKLNAKGEGSILTVLPAGQVFALCPDGRGGLLAGTGPGGKIYEIDADGKAKVFFDTKRENVLCLWREEGGDLYAGTSLPGAIFRISPEGRGWILADLGDTEVVAVARTAVGTYVAVNNGNKTNPADFLKALADATGKAPDPTKAPAAKSGQKPPQVSSALVLIAPSGEVSDLLGFNDAYITCLAPWEGGEVLVGTNTSGKVWRVGPDMEFSVWFDLKENQVLNLIQDASGVRGIGTGSPGAVHVIEKDPPKEGTYTTEVLDATAFARWGRIDWHGEGRLTLRTRSGNSRDAEDGTWSDWSDPIAAFPGKVASPPARFLQVRAEWTDDPNAVLTGITVMYVAQNQRPRFQEFSMEDVAPGADGRKTYQKKIKWKVVDADNDAAAVNVYYRAVGAETWILVNRDAPIVANEYVWTTDSLSDGKYQLRVVATDEGANPKERALSSERVTRPFLIDHTKPRIEVAIGPGGAASGVAEDAASHIAKIEWRLDGGRWQPIGSKDGLLDDPREEFSIALGDVGAGTHVLSVRATDGDQNAAIAEVEFKK